AWLAAKRGIKVDFLHFLMGSTQSSYNAFNVAKFLASNWLYGYRPRFILVDLRDLILEITKKVEWRLRQVILRAVMYTIASKIADEIGYDALITGESIGQASSQTLKNLLAIEKAVKSTRIILRPLLGFDKEEIISLSRRIGLYDLSSKVTEACAIAPTRVETAASVKEVEEELGKIDLTVINKVLSTYKVFDLLKTTPGEIIPPDEIEIDFIPEEALVIDMRSENERQSKPIPNAIPIDSIDIKKLSEDKIIVLICETGSKSYFLARALREDGFKAYSLKGGVRGYCKLP
ncbi:MAG: rhodanese-like domain-containing protein, partial [Desulfurococcaceae archaeon]